MKKFIKISVIMLSVLVFLSSCSNPEKEEIEPKIEEPAVLTVDPPKSFYEFREGVVKFSPIDPESDFAKTAVSAVKTYLEKQYSENEEIKNFEITDIEIAVNSTNWYINAYRSNGDVKEEDLINSSLIIRFRTHIEAKDGITYLKNYPDNDLTEPFEGHVWVVYDPDNKYDLQQIPGHQWKVFNTNSWSWNTDSIHTEEEIFKVMYDRTNGELPIYTFIKPEDEIAVLATKQAKAYLEECLIRDKNVLSYEIIDVFPNINHTNFYINTTTKMDVTTSSLHYGIICISLSWKMDLVDNPSINRNSVNGGFHYEYDNIPIEYNYIMRYDGGEWVFYNSSTYPHNAFDNLTENDLIEAINGLE